MIIVKVDKVPLLIKQVDCIMENGIMGSYMAMAFIAMKCDVYEGDFSLGEMHGWGSYKFINGNEYNGQWENDKIEGEGIYTSTSLVIIMKGTFQMEG